MNHTSEELFSVFFSTVFESSCISDFTQKMASFFKRYMPVSAVYISFFEKDTIFKVAEYPPMSGKLSVLSNHVWMGQAERS